MNRSHLAAFITAILGIGCIYYFMAVVYKDDNYRAMGGAIVMLVEMIVMGVIAIILNTSANTKQVSRGIFFGMFLTFLIGFGICSTV